MDLESTQDDRDRGHAMNRLLPTEPESVRTCPRCRYTGEGIGYFRRPGHLALLMGVSLFTYGVGGVVYWLVRRGNVVCPNCGLTWHDGPHAGLPAAPRASRLQRGRPAPVRREEALPSAGLKRRVLGVIMALIATVAVVIGIAEFEPAMIAAGSALGLGGTGMFFWGWRGLQERRAAITQAMERRILQLATQRGGNLTVTEVATEMDLSIPAAERILTGMDDGFRVVSEVTDDGILIFQFPEVRHRRLGTPEPPPADAY
jgi:hypothetical protein